MLKQRVLAFQLRDFEVLSVYVQLNVHAAPLRDAVIAQYCVQMLVVLHVNIFKIHLYHYLLTPVLSN
jgi:hypothetical protein